MKNADTLATDSAMTDEVPCLRLRSLVSLSASMTLWQGNLLAGR